MMIEVNPHLNEIGCHSEADRLKNQIFQLTHKLETVKQILAATNWNDSDKIEALKANI